MTTSRKKVAWIAFACLLVAIFAFTTWIGYRYIDTKSMACECDDPVDGMRFSVYSPFRDRKPEQAGAAAIRAIQSGQCLPASTPEQNYCQEERTLKIVSWKLTGRQTEKDYVVLRFWIIHRDKDRSEFGNPMWITLQPDQSSWKVTNVNTYY